MSLAAWLGRQLERTMVIAAYALTAICEFPTETKLVTEIKKHNSTVNNFYYKYNLHATE